MIVSKFMYGCGTLVLSQNESNALEMNQNEKGRWLWDVVNAKNELILDGVHLKRQKLRKW